MCKFTCSRIPLQLTILIEFIVHSQIVDHKIHMWMKFSCPINHFYRLR